MTLLEMLVVVALVVLMMTILASIFQKATEAISVSRAFQELDVELRRLDTQLRLDLDGVTAKMTPPNDPAQNRGYFEYGENAPADLQGEDTDDYLAFTARAPEGQVFTGRVWVAINQQKTAANGNPLNPVLNNPTIQPIVVTSKFAEIIYFLRNGNLYRRVLLVAPDRKTSIQLATGNPTTLGLGLFGTNTVSWQGYNDISARPNTAPTIFNGNPTNSLPIVNTLGDLTNRENRFARPRYCDDFRVAANNNNFGSDGFPDDTNNDGLPDYHPTLYYQAFSSTQTALGTTQVPQYVRNSWGNGNALPPVTTSDVMAFPYVFPGMFSQAYPTNLVGQGWLHSIDPSNQTFNHNPIDTGDTLYAPTPGATNQQSSWWGFPTWKETLSFRWQDPVMSVNRTGTGTNAWQPWGLRPWDASTNPMGQNSRNLLPPSGIDSKVPYTTDGYGQQSFITNGLAATDLNTITSQGVWQDDLVMTNVRSFDVKAYDPDARLYSTNAVSFLAGYYDLGYGGLRPGPTGAGLQPINANLLAGTLTPPVQFFSGNDPLGFGHEGRMPPMTGDLRVNPSRPAFNVGDNDPSINRMRRVWDSWSTAYTEAPVDINLNGSLLVGNQPPYPSFPPPYPSALRGIQIQIRVTDPRSSRIKVLTIRQDFTDKLN